MPFIITRNDGGEDKDSGTRDGEPLAHKNRARYWQKLRRGSGTSPTCPDPNKGSSSNLMNLPTELRLRIYEYVFDDRSLITLFNGSDVIVLVNSTDQSKADTNQHSRRTDLLRVCRQIHDEAEDVFFNRTLFGIIASPYQEPARISQGLEGLRPMPDGRISISTLQRVRKLLLVMVPRGAAYSRYGYRIGDLRWLQTMTGLKEVRIVFTAPVNVSLREVNMSPVRAVVESVPATVRLLFGPQPPRPDEEAEADSSSSSTTRASKEEGNAMYVSMRRFTDTIVEHRGMLSGSVFDHSLCTFENCLESRGCVNSEMRTPLPKKQGAVSRFMHALTPRAGPGSLRLLGTI